MFPKFSLTPQTTYQKKIVKNPCILLAIMYINHRNVEDNMSDAYADVGT